jgi:hypothetical protein
MENGENVVIMFGTWRQKCCNKQEDENSGKCLFIDVSPVELISVNKLDLELSVLKSIKSHIIEGIHNELLKYDGIAVKKWILSL